MENLDRINSICKTLRSCECFLSGIQESVLQAGHIVLVSDPIGQNTFEILLSDFNKPEIEFIILRKRNLKRGKV